MSHKPRSVFIVCAATGILLISLACAVTTPVTQMPSEGPDLQATIAAGVQGTQTGAVPTANLAATVAAGIARTQMALAQLTPSRTPTRVPPTVIPSPTPDMSSLKGDANLAVGKPVIDRAGGINYEAWGQARDEVDFNSITKPGGGRWGIETNTGSKGAYAVVDLLRASTITGIGYRLDWDAAFKNPLKFVVQVSDDLQTWVTVSEITHPYDGVTGSSIVNIKIAIDTIKARYVKFWEPPDGAWNGWGDFFEVRVYGKVE